MISAFPQLVPNSGFELLQIKSHSVFCWNSPAAVRNKHEMPIYVECCCTVNLLLSYSHPHKIFEVPYMFAIAILQ